jgi:replicative DNA helicase
MVDQQELDWRESIDAETEETDKLLEMAEAAIAESRARRGAAPAKKDVERGPTKTSECLQDWYRRFETEQKDPEAGRLVSTGIDDIDKKLRMRAGEMTILAARPGMGKSALAGQIASFSAARGDNVLFFSLEMSLGQLIGRMISHDGRVNIRGRVGNDDYPKILRSCDRIHQWPMWIDDRAGLGSKQIRSAALKVPKPKLIVVDYIGRMAEDKSAQRHDIAVGNNAKALCDLAKDFGCHVMALCQLNREVEKRNPPRPMLSDLRDSGNLEEHANNVVMIYREGYYKNGVKDKDTGKQVKDNTAEILIEKQRDGERGAVKVAWVGEYQTFAGLDKQTYWNEKGEKDDD